MNSSGPVPSPPSSGMNAASVVGNGASDHSYASHKLASLHSDLKAQKSRWALLDSGSPRATLTAELIRETQDRISELESELILTTKTLPYLKLDPNLPDLKRGSLHAAGIDLYNAGPDLWIVAHSSQVIPAGIKVAIPEGYYGHVAVRSGLGFNKGLASHIGVVDADFRGKVRIKLFNHSNVDVEIKQYDRVAQLVILPYLHCHPVEVEELPETERGEGGYGSTGS